MPLIQSPSKKAFKKNVEKEMSSNPSPKDRAQNLAIAYSIKRKNSRKKMADGGAPDPTPTPAPNMNFDTSDTHKYGLDSTFQSDKPGTSTSDKIRNYFSSSKAKGGMIKKYADGGSIDESAASERRPMPDERDKDSRMVARNSGDKPSKNDNATDNITIKQAQKPSRVPLSQPKMAKITGPFSVRNRDMRDDENDLGDRIYPETDKAQPIQRDNEDSPNRQGPQVSDMEDQHKAKRAPYKMAKEDQYSQDESEDDMNKIQSPLGRYAKGGAVLEPKDHDNELMERNQEAHMQSELSPSEDEGDMDAHTRDELDADMENPDALDMEDEHTTGRKPYAKGGSIQYDDAMNNETDDMDINPIRSEHSKDDSEDVPDDEADMEHYDSVAAAIMAKKEAQSRLNSGSEDMDRMVLMYEGGQLEGSDESMVDIDENGEEQPNGYYKHNEDDVLKENYDSDMDGISQPLDSNEHGDDLDSDKHDMVEIIRRKMATKRALR